MELHIISQVKRIGQLIIADFPVFCQVCNDFIIRIDLDQRTEHTIEEGKHRIGIRTNRITADDLRDSRDI